MALHVSRETLGELFQKIVTNSEHMFSKLQHKKLVLLRIAKSILRPPLNSHFTLKIEVGVLLCARIIYRGRQAVRESAGILAKSTGHEYYFLRN